MADYRGVILDVDGTLIDSNDAHAEAWQKALAKHGYDVSFQRIRGLIGMGGDNLLPELIQVEKESSEGTRISESWSEIFEEQYMPHLKAFPQTREMVEKMRERGLKVVVATSAEGEMVEQLLEIAGVNDLIEERTSASDAESSKPDPDIIQAALDDLGLPPDQVVMVGDTPFDIEAAAKTSVGVIALRCGGFTDEELAGAIEIYDSPADLLAQYDQSPLSPKRREEEELGHS